MQDHYAVNKCHSRPEIPHYNYEIGTSHNRNRCIHSHKIHTHAHTHTHTVLCKSIACPGNGIHTYIH